MLFSKWKNIFYNLIELAEAKAKKTQTNIQQIIIQTKENRFGSCCQYKE